MKCLCYRAFGEIVLAETPIPRLAAGEVLVKVLACGICGSELETFRAQSPRRMPPLVMGHEFCGKVVQCGEGVTGFVLGQYVVSHSLVSCDRCFYCLRNAQHLCAKRQVFGMHRQGALAEYVNVPAQCLLPVSVSVDPGAACLAEPLANGLHMVKLVRHVKPVSVAIIGAGAIGLMALQAFKALCPVEVVVADISQQRLLTANRLGAKHTIHVRTTDFVTAVHDHYPEGVDVVIDAAGLAQTQAGALRVVRAGGAVVLVGLHENANPFWSYDLVLNEKQVIGSYAATRHELAVAIKLIETKAVDVTSWTRRVRLDEAADVFRHLVEGDDDVIKAVVMASLPRPPAY